MNKENELEEISGGAAVAGQAFVVFVILPIMLALTFLLIHLGAKMELNTGIIVFILIIFGAGVLITKVSYRNADLYFSGDQIVIKKLFKTVKRPVTTYKNINDTLLPYKYYIEFEDGKRVYFTIKKIDFKVGLNTSSSNPLKQIADRFEQKKMVLN